MIIAFALLSTTVGVTSASLIPFSRLIARTLWPGPGVKGPGDVYVQAFQALLCVAVLIAIAVVTSVVSLVLSIRGDWTIGIWLSGLPIAIVVIELVVLRFRS
jgi:hypothetical protein